MLCPMVTIILHSITLQGTLSMCRECTWCVKVHTMKCAVHDYAGDYNLNIQYCASFECYKIHTLY